VGEHGDITSPSGGGRTLPRRRDSWVFRLGVGLIAISVGLFGWVGWEMFGTNYVSAQKHQAIVGDITREWAQGGQTVEAAGTQVASLVRIPRFGRKYAVPVLEGTTPRVLASGFGHFKSSAGPGDAGNFALAAHRVTHGEPLRRMPQLRPGDEIVIETAVARYTYVLDTAGDALSVDFTQSWVLDPLPVNPNGGVQPPAGAGEHLITIATCAELFHTDSRLVAFGHLEKVEPRG
jgi:sortase A